MDQGRDERDDDAFILSNCRDGEQDEAVSCFGLLFGWFLLCFLDSNYKRQVLPGSGQIED